MRDVRVLNMEDYGMTGTVEISKPTLRRRIQRDNAIGNCTRADLVNGEPVVSETRVGDAAVIKVLAYVGKAPFPTDLNGFLNYCDKMDSNDLGSAERLITDIEAAALQIEEGETPLPDSQGAETPSSD